MSADAPHRSDAIAPREEERVALWFGPSGPLAKEDGFEERPEQRQMAVEVARALQTGHHAVLEAGTGTGKTLAYLVPAVLSGKKVIVSTATKALQEQLVDKDLPSLRKSGLKFDFAVMKGRANYLCLYRKEVFDAEPTFVSRDEALSYRKLHEWSKTTKSGDRAEIDLPEQYTAWRDVSSTTETCLGQECPRYTDCYVVKMRQAAQEADVVVVNHHLFFADLALRQSPAARAGAEVVPKAEAVIFDEAHNIEEVATEFFGSQISNWRFYDLCRDLDRAAKVKDGWPAVLIAGHTARIGRAVDAFFNALAELAPEDVASRKGDSKKWQPATPKPAPRFELPPPTVDLFTKKSPDAPREISADTDELISRAVVVDAAVVPSFNDRREARWTLEPGSLEPLLPLRDVLAGELKALEGVLADAGRGGEDAELDGFVRRSEELRGSLDLLSSLSEPNLVYWAEQRGRGVFLRASPVDVAGQLRRALFEKEQPVVMTSATLATGDDTLFFQRRVGLTLGAKAVRPTREAVFASPFDYDKQAALYLPRHLPEPNAPDFLDKAVDDIAALIALAKGRTFVLFTSTRSMNEVHRRLAPRIPYQVLLQGQKPKGALVRDFKATSSVLFATQSFWEGVDVQGDALSMVIIDKLPFASPGDPLVAARLQSIADRGGSSFGEYQLPSAAIALKQGFGRLIRSRSDTGAVAILDKRLWTKGYGGYLRRSLPRCPTFDGFAGLKQWWRDERVAVNSDT